MEFKLNIYETMALVSIVFYLGNLIKNKFAIFSKYCIPPAVIGGFIFALLILIFHMTGIASINLDTTLQSIFMTAFFTSIGFTASITVLKQGGIKVILFLFLATTLVILQNTVGVALASLFNLPPLLGLCTGSIPMVGGHGTAGSFGPLIEDLNIVGATTISMASATFGLIMGSIIGGFVAKNLIQKHKLKVKSDKTQVNLSDITAEVAVDSVDNIQNTLSISTLTNAACFLFIAMGFGSIISKVMEYWELTFPSYIGAMLAAAIIRNLYDAFRKELPDKEIETLGSLSLSFFLTMALMGLKLWELFDLALPLMIMLVAQTLLVGLFAYFVIYRAMGKNYEAAVFASATCGFGMGATPNAIANMDELTHQFGFAPTPYFVVPIVGCLFIDFVNSGVLMTFINFLS